jgi:hypothetical protein
MKIVAILVTVSFLFVSCASRQPYRKSEVTEEGGTLSDYMKRPKKEKKASQWFGPTEKAILSILVIGLLIAAGFYGMKKQLDEADWHFNPNALYP